MKGIPAFCLPSDKILFREILKKTIVQQPYRGGGQTRGAAAVSLILIVLIFDGKMFCITVGERGKVSGGEWLTLG